MAIPAQHEFYRPVLEVVAAAESGLNRKEIISRVAEHLGLTEEDLQVLTRGKTKPRVESHVHQVVYAAKKSELVFSSEHGKTRISPKGREFLAQHQGNIPIAAVQQLILHSEEGSEVASIMFPDPANTLPEDMMDSIHQQLRNQLAEEILDNLKSVASDRFEEVVIELLERMGYGHGLVTRHTHDGGIDGILSQDVLGLMEKVCVQAKRWSNNTVGEPEVTAFAGSIGNAGANKGVFITTSRFTTALKNRATVNVVITDNKSIRLIDGPELAQLLIDHDLGVVTEITYVVKRLDTNYFPENSVAAAS